MGKSERGMGGEWVGWMGRIGGIRWGKVEEEIDRKVTLVALRSFLFGDWG